MRKIFLIIFGIFLLSCLIPASVSAELVPCGMSGDDPSTTFYENCPCTFCHFFVMFNRIIDFVLIDIVPAVAVLLLVIAGIYFFTAAGDPNKLGEAKKIITAVVLGLLIIFSSWIFINMFFDFIGVSEWTGLRQGWWQIDCPVPNPDTDIDSDCTMNCDNCPDGAPCAIIGEKEPQSWCVNDANHNHINDD